MVAPITSLSSAAGSALQRVSTSMVERKAKLERNAKIALILGAGLVVAPFVATAIGGLVGIGVAGVLSMGMLAAMKPVSMKFANWRLQAIKAVARQNPIESTENAYIAGEQRLSSMLQEITTFEGKVLTYKRQVEGFSQRFPSEAPRFAEHLKAMQSVLASRQDRYRQAKSDQVGLKEAIEKAKAVWEMSLASEEINTDAEAGEEVLRQIVIDTSLEEVQRRADASMASLNAIMLKEYEPPQLSSSTGEVLQPLEVKEPTQVLHRGAK